MKRILIVVICSLTISCCFSQSDTSKFSIGLNIVPMYSGSAELQISYSFNKYIGICASGGIVDRPIRGGNKDDDFVYLNSSHGSYFKLGLIGTWPLKSRLSPWLKIMYIGSFYNETGNNHYFNPPKGIHAKGFLNGVGIAAGIDLKMRRRIYFRTGLQIGSFTRTDHIGGSNKTVQPGFGFTVGTPKGNGAISLEPILGFAFKF